MVTEKNSISDIIICILVTFLIVAFYVFELEWWGRYVAFVVSALVALIHSSQNGMRIRIKMEAFHIYILAFALFCYLSAVWAWNSSLAISKGTTVVSMVVCFSLLYPYYEKKGSIESLMKSIMLSGYVICAYTISFYGINSFTSMLSGAVRIGNDFTNANGIGLVASTSCIIQVYFWLQKKRSIIAIFMVPTIMALAVSQSRKAIIMLVVGVTFLIATVNAGKNAGKKILGFVASVVVLFLLLFIMTKVEIFQGVMRRFDTLFESLNGTRAEDIRAVYRRIGFDQFLKTPVFGIGIGNSLEMLERAGQRRTYTHCNYVELLASGGVVGFFIYYAIYIKLIKGLWRNRMYDIEMTNLCIILIVLMLIMDYGMVTYYDKPQYLYFMCFFLQLKFVEERKKHELCEMEENK